MTRKKNNESAKDLWAQVFARSAESEFATLQDPSHDEVIDEARIVEGLRASGWREDLIELIIERHRHERANAPVTSPGVNPFVESHLARRTKWNSRWIPVRHRNTDSFGFSFESRARRHPRSDRLAALEVPDGPVRRDLAEGRPATLADGRTIDPEDVLGPPEGSKKLVIVGDAETTERLGEQVRDADVLVIEATFLDRDAAIARDYGHLVSQLFACDDPFLLETLVWNVDIDDWKMKPQHVSSQHFLAQALYAIL